jgi:hypothetical protein
MTSTANGLDIVIRLILYLDSLLPLPNGGSFFGWERGPGHIG